MSAAAFSSTPLRRLVARSAAAPLRRPRALPPRLPRSCAAYSTDDWQPSAESGIPSDDAARQQATAAYGGASAASSSSGAAASSSAEQRFDAEPSSSTAAESRAPTAAELFSSDYFGAAESSKAATRGASPSSSSSKLTSAQSEELAGDAEALYASLFAEPEGSYPFASPWAGRPVRPEVVRRTKNRDRAAAATALTPAEIESFRDILNIPNRHGDEADLHADASYGSLDEERQAAATGFGSSMRRDGPSALEAFYERNALKPASAGSGGTRGGYLLPQGWRGRQGIVQDAQAKKRPAAIGALREGVSVERVGHAEMERTLEEARAEVAACESVADVWQWAAEHVLRSPEEESATREARAPTGDASDASLSAPAPVRYGSMTAFYAPVLLILLRDLRERFHSPLSALAMLEAASLRGVVSLVQLTPTLYSEAIQTRHSILGDLSGAYASLQTARATGVVPAPPKSDRIVVPRFSDSEAAQRKDEETLRRVVEEVTTQVRETAVMRRLSLDTRGKPESRQLYDDSNGPADVRFRSEKARQDVRIADAMSALAGYSRATSIVLDEPQAESRHSKSRTGSWSNLAFRSRKKGL